MAIAVLLQGFADIPLAWGIALTGVCTMFSMAIGLLPPNTTPGATR